MSSSRAASRSGLAPASSRRTRSSKDDALNAIQHCTTCQLAQAACCCAKAPKRLKTTTKQPTRTSSSRARSAKSKTTTAAPAAAAVGPAVAVAGTGTNSTDDSQSQPLQQEERQQQQPVLQLSNESVSLVACGGQQALGLLESNQATYVTPTPAQYSATLMPAHIPAPSTPPSLESLFYASPSAQHGTNALPSAASPMLQTISRAQLNNIDDIDNSADEENDNEEEPEPKMTEQEGQLLWLSTIDALTHVSQQDKYKYILDDKKRARVVRERYWKLVRDAAIWSNRTGVQIFLAAGQPYPGSHGFKQHVFASAGLCNESNKCMHDAANKMADIWISTLTSYRELLITQNKEKDDLLRHHQARYLADQQIIKEKDQALSSAMSTAAALRIEIERLKHQSGHASDLSAPSGSSVPSSLGRQTIDPFFNM